MKLHELRLLAVCVAVTALGACAGGQTRPKTAPAPLAAVTPTETKAVFDLLMAGKERDARKFLDKLLERDPVSPSAQMLNDSIKRDPKELLGPASYPYTARAGDTVGDLAQRFLGNRLKAYQLLRYNGLRTPVLLAPGQMLRIPGEPPRLEPVRRPTTLAPSRLAPAPPATLPNPKPVAPKPVARAPTANPAAARIARAAGLAALNGGDINRSVGLLRRAAALDSGNPAISRDLARAERIAATVRARK